MKLVFFSDTHGKHREVILPLGDVLIYCGDMCSSSTLQDVADFCIYLKKWPHKHKIVIAGNHDFPFENEYREKAEKLVFKAGGIYLNDSGFSIDEIKFWGSPIQPEFCNWAFNRKIGRDIKKHWDKIPLDTDILITHGPPADIMDLCANGRKVGCEDLLLTVKKIKPKIHAFGHIHEGYGTKQIEDTTFVNASNLNERYLCVNKAIELEV